MKGHLFSHMARTNSTSLDSLIAYILLPPCSAPRRIDEVAKASTRATHPCVNSNNSKPGPPDELPQICCSPKVPGSKRPPCQGGKHQEKQRKRFAKHTKTRKQGNPSVLLSQVQCFCGFFSLSCLLLNLCTGTARVLSLRRARYAFSQTLLICATEVDGTESCNGRYQRCDWLFLEAFRGVLSRSFLAPPSSCGQCCSLVGVEYGPVGPVLAKAPGPPPLEESP